ncbi:hypothetical protein STAQ_08930 [Allostella sp. ATCC 35155]|nr:hypothetical protein STAQ_08930 [Stella sp. ATCC 35155]
MNTTVAQMSTVAKVSHFTHSPTRWFTASPQRTKAASADIPSPELSAAGQPPPADPAFPIILCRSHLGQPSAIRNAIVAETGTRRPAH